MIVRELITRLGFSMNESQFNKAEASVKKVQDHAEKAAQSVRRLVATVASIATVRTVLTIADEMQNIRSRLSLLPQTLGDVGASFDTVAAHANAAGVQISAYTSLYTRIGNAAKDYIKTQEDLLDITDTISRALVVGGASTQESAAVMTQFSQALASGVLQGDEFRSMAEAAPQYLDKLSEAMNIPREQLKKMASDGKLTAKAVIEATRQMSGYFEDKFKQMPVTVGRAMTIVGNRFSLMLDRMNRDTNFVSSIANSILGAFDLIESGVTRLIKAFGGWENAIRLLGFALGVSLGAKALSVLASLRMATFAAMLPFLKLAAVITAVTLVIEDLYVWIKGGDSVIGSFIGNWQDVGETITGVAAGIAIVVGMFSLWKAAVIGYTIALKGYEAALLAVAAVKRGLIVVAFLLNAVMALNPIGLIVVAIGALIAAGVLLIANWQTVKDWFANLFSWFAEKFADLGKWVSDLLKKAGSVLGIGGDSAGATGDNITPANTVTAAQLTPEAMGAARPNIQSNITVTVTVPPGTTAEQARFLQNVAQQSFDSTSNDKLARDLATYAP